MSSELDGKKIAILVTDGFEESELARPRQALIDAGADTVLVSPAKDKVRAWQSTEWGPDYRVDQPLESANPDDYDALLLPGGVANPDKLRINQEAVNFVRSFVLAHKPIAAICHGPWTLIEAGGVEGRRVTSWPSLQTDLRNAGAFWENSEVVVDSGLVTSRNPDDIPAFNKRMIEEFREGVHSQQEQLAGFAR